MLLQAGVDAKAKDIYSKTALDYAQEKGHAKVTTLLAIDNATTNQ